MMNTRTDSDTAQSSTSLDTDPFSGIPVERKHDDKGNASKEK